MMVTDLVLYSYLLTQVGNPDGPDKPNKKLYVVFFPCYGRRANRCYSYDPVSIKDHSLPRTLSLAKSTTAILRQPERLLNPGLELVPFCMSGW